MANLIDAPILLFAASFTLFLACAGLSARAFHHHPRRSTETRDDLKTVLAASLTLLGLIIGFTFSMAVSRYDLRKSYEASESNTIGTEYLRASLLPAADAAPVRELLKSYADERISFY